MNYTIGFRDDVFFELNEIYDWYESQSKGLGKLFIDQLDLCFDSIGSNPLHFPKKYKNFRQALTKKFPYLIIFEIESDKIIVYRIIHTSRNPKLKFKK